MFNKLMFRYFSMKNIMFLITLLIFLVLVFTCKDIVIMFFASFVLACSLNPIVDKMSAKIPRNLAAVIVLLVLSGLITATFVPVIIISAEEIKNFAISFPKFVDNIDDYILQMPIFQHFNYNGINFAEMMSVASASSADMINNLVNFGKNIGSAFVYIFVSVILIFNMIVDKDLIKNFYLGVFPKNMRKKAEEIGNIISAKLGGYITALFVTMFSVFLVMLIGLYICKNEYAFILALIMGVLDIIPVIGPALALAICIIASYQAGLNAVIAVIVVFSIAQLLENNVVRPYIFGKLMDIHPIVIFLFLFLAAKTMGIVGVIFAPALATLVSVLFVELYMKNLD